MTSWSNKMIEDFVAELNNGQLDGIENLQHPQGVLRRAQCLPLTDTAQIYLMVVPPLAIGYTQK